MPLESATYVGELNAANPLQTEGLNTADDHLRLIKSTILASFPNIEGAVSGSHTFFNNGAIPQGVIVLWSGSVGSIPTGWALCDGTAGINKEDGSGTFTAPDLRNRFIVGAGDTYAVAATGGATSVTSGAGGSHTHSISLSGDGSHTHSGATGSTALSEANLPSHVHKMFASVTGNSGSNLPDSTEQVAVENETGGGGSYDMYGTSTAATLGETSSVGSGTGHTHSIGSSGSTHSHSGTTGSESAHTHSVSTLSPYYALCYIIRK